MTGDRFGPYTLVDVLGRGGMGEVHRARDHEHDDRLVALKVLPADLSGDPEYRARFRREAMQIARLSEPHVPAIHRYGEIDGRLFLDMELVPGRDLATVLAAGPLPVATAVDVVGQVAAALDAAHAAGLVHRDVKPANVLLEERTGRRPHVTLIDFGIATPTDPGSNTALTRTGAVIGTVAYMAPERFLAEPAGPPADVYSLACVFHELLTGLPPFPRDQLELVMAAHLHRPPPAPSAARADLPAGFDPVVARGMAKRPGDRFASAGALAAAARAALSPAFLPRSSPTPDAASTTPTPPRLTRPAVLPPTLVADVPAPETPRARRWWLAPAGVGLAVGGIALVAALLTGLVPAPGRAPGASTGPAAPAAAAPVEPSGGALTERAFVGLGETAPAVSWLGEAPVLVPTVSSPVQVVDLATGGPIGAAVPTYTHAAAVTRHNGRTLLVGTSDTVIREWDLATGEPLPATMSGHTKDVAAVAVGTVDGRDVVASTSYDRTLRRWDLETGTPVGEPITIAGPASDLSVVSVGGRPLLVTTSLGFTPPQGWDLATGAPIGRPLPDRLSDQIVLGVAGGRLLEAAEANYLDGTYAATPGVLRLRILDLIRGGTFAEVTITLPAGSFPTIAAITEVTGRPILVLKVGSEVRLYDLRTGAAVGGPLTGHEDKVLTAMPFTAAGRSYLLTRSVDRSVRLWDLTGRVGA
jgi:serine/threonine-protein kinase